MNNLKGYKILHNPKFEKAFALKPGFRFNALRDHCEDIVFATDGFKTDIDEIASQLRDAFEDFDPDRDCIIPIGNSFVNLLAGYLLLLNFPGKPLVIALYNKEYEDPVRGMIPDHYVFYQIDMQDLLKTSVVDFLPTLEHGG